MQERGDQLPDAYVGAASCFEVSKTVYEKIAYRGGTEGLTAIVRSRFLKLTDLVLSEHPLIVVLERVEKPGNLGAVLRSADAAGADAVVICDPLTDLFNPNLIRSSIGAIFSVPCVACSSEECITDSFLRQRCSRKGSECPVHTSRGWGRSPLSYYSLHNNESVPAWP